MIWKYEFIIGEYFIIFSRQSHPNLIIIIHIFWKLIIQSTWNDPLPPEGVTKIGNFRKYPIGKAK